MFKSPDDGDADSTAMRVLRSIVPPRLRGLGLGGGTATATAPPQQTTATPPQATATPPRRWRAAAGPSDQFTWVDINGSPVNPPPPGRYDWASDGHQVDLYPLHTIEVLLDPAAGVERRNALAGARNRTTIPDPTATAPLASTGQAVRFRNNSAGTVTVTNHGIGQADISEFR